MSASSSAVQTTLLTKAIQESESRVMGAIRTVTERVENVAVLLHLGGILLSPEAQRRHAAMRADDVQGASAESRKRPETAETHGRSVRARTAEEVRIVPAAPTPVMEGFPAGWRVGALFSCIRKPGFSNRVYSGPPDPSANASADMTSTSTLPRRIR